MESSVVLLQVFPSVNSIRGAVTDSQLAALTRLKRRVLNSTVVSFVVRQKV